jgi:carbonic anhydrase
MKTLTKERLVTMTPQEALDLLKEGNQRFLYNQKAGRNLLEQVNQTSTGQFPFAVILGCIDSRVAPELVFDLGIGDVFSIRIAGNFVNEDILGSMEFACKVIGSKQILVLGHTSCGAVQGALDDVELGNLTQLVSKIKPAVDAAKRELDQNSNPSVDRVAEINVNTTIDQILQRSPILKEMLDNQEIGISGAMYDVASGKVSFL